METIFIAVIEHDHGHNFYAHTSEAGALKAVADYCREWYEAEIGVSLADAILDEFITDTTDEAVIESYFANTERESYIIDQTELQP